MVERRIGHRMHHLTYNFGGTWSLKSDEQEEKTSAEFFAKPPLKIVALLKDGHAKGILKDANVRLGRRNGLTLTKYEKGDSLNWHTDNESIHGDRAIASVSLGDDADFYFKSSEQGVEEVKITLKSGDLVIFDRLMPHKIEQVRGTRYNLTYRNVQLPFHDL